MSVSLVARVAPNQVFTWRRLYAEGALSAIGTGEEVVAASEYRALQHQVRELRRLLGKKTLVLNQKTPPAGIPFIDSVFRNRALAGLQKSGALDYTAPFLSGKVPAGFAAGFAGGAGGLLVGQSRALQNQQMQANTGLLGANTQKANLETQSLRSQLDMAQRVLGSAADSLLYAPRWSAAPG